MATSIDGRARGGTRVLSAQRTRSRVLEAAAVLFSERGYGRTSLRAIADHAGVSVETVGLAGPKRRLLRDAFDMAFAGKRDAFPAAGEPAYVGLAAELGLDDAIGPYIRLLAASLARTSGLWAAFQAAADSDPEAAALFAEIRQQRRVEFARTAHWLVDRGAVDADRVDWVVRQFYLIASHETYLLLHSEFGCTAEDFAAHLLERVRGLLA